VTDASKPKRRWYQFSLRRLFVLMSVLGVCLGYIMMDVEQYHRETKLMEEMTKVIGQPPKYARMVGFVWALHIDRLDLQSAKLSQEQLDKCLEIAGQLPYLTTLDIRGHRVSAEVAERIGAMKQLCYLHLTIKDADEKCIDCVAMLPNLKQVSFDDYESGGEAAWRLRGLRPDLRVY
jgi:hypothetical protein